MLAAMLAEETKENLRQVYHWVTSLSEESLEWLAALRLDTRSPATITALANAVWVQLTAYAERYKATVGTEHAEFLFQYAQSLHRNPRWLLDQPPTVNKETPMNITTEQINTVLAALLNDPTPQEEIRQALVAIQKGYPVRYYGYKNHAMAIACKQLEAMGLLGPVGG